MFISVHSVWQAIVHTVLSPLAYLPLHRVAANACSPAVMLRVRTYMYVNMTTSGQKNLHYERHDGSLAPSA